MVGFGLLAKSILWLGVIVVAAFRPKAGELSFQKLESLGRRFALHPVAVWISAGLLVLVLRAALLPWWPAPKPVIYDEFSYLLGADTFAHGRLTNPTHKLWTFFESPYVLQQPTYAAKYPPAQSLFLAAGEVAFGHPWFGVWLSCGLMAAAIVWAIQGWLPAPWALLGAILVLPLSTGSYWMNSYWGGAVAALGGALLIGGYARVVKPRQILYALPMAAGIAILMNSRPYEGLVFSIPIAIAFLTVRPRIVAVAVLAALLIPVFAATGYYNRAVTGSALEMPFTEYARQYVYIPLFNFLPLQSTKVYRNPVLYDLHQNWEPEEWRKARSLQLIPIRLADWRNAAGMLLGSVALAIPIVLFFPDLWRDRRIRLPLVCVLAALAGSLAEVRYYEHYAGPATAALFIVAIQGLRHLRHWTTSGVPAGRLLSQAIPALVIVLAGASTAMSIVRPPGLPVNASRDEIAKSLREQGGKHVILVHYTGSQSPHEEWVYNSADIDSQDVIWAHDLGVEEDAALVRYYKDRTIWRFQPDLNPKWLDPYPAGKSLPSLSAQ